MQKRKNVISMLVFLILLTTTFVVAQSDLNPFAAQKAGEDVNFLGKTFLSFIGGIFLTDPTPLNILPTIFMGIILFLLIYSAIDTSDILKSKDGNNPVIYLLTFAVTMLALIALPENFFAVILPSYGAMGATLLTILPFLIILFFTIKINRIFIAQIIWGLFAAYFVGYYAIIVMGLYDLGGAENIRYANFYIVIGLVGAAMFFLIGPIRAYFMKGASEEARKEVYLGGKKIDAALEALGDTAETLQREGQGVMDH